MAEISEAGVGGLSGAAPTPAKPLRKLRATVAHSTRGRMRLRLSGASAAELQRVEARVRTLPHVHKVEVHPGSGSILVHHGAGHRDLVSSLVDLARHSALFSLEMSEDSSEAAGQLTDVEHDVEYLADHSRSGRIIIRYAEHLNRAVKQATGGWVDLRVLLPATAGICALIFVEVESAPLWLPLALFSFQSFNILHEPHPTTEGEAAGPPTLSARTKALPEPPEQAPDQATTRPASRPKRAAKKAATLRTEES